MDLEFQLRPIIISLPQTPYLSTLFATKKPFKTAIRLPPQAQLTYPNSPSRSKNSTGIYGHGGTHQRPPHPQQDLRKHARGARTRVDGIAPVAFTSPLLGRLEMTSMAIEDLRRYDPSQHHSIHMHGTSQSIASQWNTISQPSVLVSIFVALVPLVYKLVQHTAAARGRPLPPLGEILWDTLVFIIPASVLYAIDRWANPPLFPIPMLQPRPTTHADKSDVMRRILRVDQPGGIVASVSQAGKRAYTNTLSSFKGDLSQPAGLVNWDNSCFQNSTLQGLASLKHLPRYLAGLTTSQSVTGDDTSTTAGSLRAFIADLNDPSNNGKTLRAPGVLRNMSTIQQQDAQEYFSKLVDQVDKDVEKSAKTTCRLPGLEAELSRDDTVASQHSDDSGYQSLPMLSKAGSELMTIRNPLEGLSAQRVACTACGYSEGLSMIPFNCLTLNFEIGVSDYSLFELLNNYVQLESIASVDCAKCTLLGYAKKLQQMAKVIPAAAERLEAVERMLEEDEFDDESMKKLRITDSNKVSSTKTKQVAIGRAPPSLVMHMNRSVFDPMTFRSYKNLAAVRFPKLLDLGPWCIGSAEGVDMASEVGADDRKESQRPDNVAHKEQWVLDATASMVAGDSHPSKISGPIYELRAVVTHYGRHDNGHYICYRKHPRGTTNASEGTKAKEGADQPPNLMGDEQPDGVGGTNGSSTEHTASAPKDPEELYSEDEDSQWWRLSDETVSKVSEKDVLSQGGVFMLFYDCIDPNSILITPGDTLEAENPLETTSTSTKQGIRKSPSWSDESVTTLCNAHADQEYAASEASSVTMVTEGEHGSAKKYDGISHVMTVTELSDEEHETAEQDAGVADDSSVAFSRASSVTMVGEENHASWSGTGGNSVTNNTATRSERVPV